jgi:DNA-binding MarR family transcriptional regulator
MGRFSIIPASAVTDERLSLRDLSVLAAIGLHTDRDGWCYPTLGRIGELLGVTRQAVQKSMRVLCDCGYIETRERRRDDGGQASNRMRVLYDTEHPASVLRAIASPTPATPEVAPPATPEVAHNVPSNDINPKGLNKGTRATSAQMFELPEWVPADLWASWLDVRKKIRAPNTPDAMRFNVRTLEKLRANGQDPAAVLEQSIARGWRGLFPVKPETPSHGTNHPSSRRESVAERAERINREHDAREGLF